MDRQEAIKRLKENTSAFGLMDRELQELAEDIGRSPNFQAFIYSAEWAGINDGSQKFSKSATYRLRPDFTEQPEVIEVEIKQDTAGDLRCAVYSYTVAPMITRLNNQSVRFAGYKYADGRVSKWSVLSGTVDEADGRPLSLEFPVSALFVRAK